MSELSVALIYFVREDVSQLFVLWTAETVALEKTTPLVSFDLRYGHDDRG